jgi:hypothetical protein
MRSKNIFVLVSDVWHTVASYLDRRTLIQLCLTSSQFLEIIRPILYRHLILTLGLDSRKYKYTNLTLKLLCSHDTLARHVTSFTICAPFESYSSINRPTRRCKVIRKLFTRIQDGLGGLADAIAKMTSLETIHMHNTVFASVTEERAFADSLREHNIPVRNLTLIADCRLGRAVLSESGLILNNLTTLTWNLKYIGERNQSKVYHATMTKSCLQLSASWQRH